MNPDLEKCMKEPGAIPSLPLVYDEINRAVRDPLITIQALAELIADDPGIGSRLLKLANSGFYGFPSQVNTISEAVTLIGLKQVRDLTLATVVIEAFDGINPVLMTMNDFWKHSLSCGIAARAIAAKLEEASLERYFVAGLLHDLGRLIIFSQFTEKAEQILERAQEEKRLFGSLEQEVLGFDHAEAGEALLAYWQLPLPVRDTVRWHHHPEKAKQSSQEATIIHVADLMVNALQIGTSGERGVPPISMEKIKTLGLPPESMGVLIDEIERQFLDVEHIFLKT